MSDVTDADRELAEEIIANAMSFKAVADPVLYSRDKLLSQLNHGFAAHRIAAERAAVERVVKRIRQDADDTGNREVLNRMADILEREGAK